MKKAPKEFSKNDKMKKYKISKMKLWIYVFIEIKKSMDQSLLQISP